MDIKKRHLESYRIAVKARVKCAQGTDLGVSVSDIPWNLGINGVEFGYALEAGMLPLKAIEAGTANAPATLGRNPPKSGLLKEGYFADFIGLEEDPVKDISVLAKPEKIKWV